MMPATQGNTGLLLRIRFFYQGNNPHPIFMR